jgi:hypothetical protein
MMGDAKGLKGVKNTQYTMSQTIMIDEQNPLKI